jgi:hypothetical protein
MCKHGHGVDLRNVGLVDDFWEGKDEEGWERQEDARRSCSLLRSSAIQFQLSADDNE